MKINILYVIVFTILIICLSGCSISPKSFLNTKSNERLLYLAIDSDADWYYFVDKALEGGADINKLHYKHTDGTLHPYTFSDNPLKIALMLGSFNTVYKLLESGADVNYDDGTGISILEWAISNCSVKYVKQREIIAEIIEKGADLSYIDGDGNSVLEYVLLNADDQYSAEFLVNILLQNGAVVRQETIDLLIDDIYKKPYIGLEILRNLVDCGNGKIEVDEKMLLALEGNNEELLKRTPDIDIHNTKDIVTLYCMAAFCKPQVLEYYMAVEEGLPKRSYTFSLLDTAAYYNNLDNVKLFVENGYEINKFNDNTMSNSVLWAVCSDSLEAAKILLDAGGIPIYKNKITELHQDGLAIASERNNLEMAKLLLQYDFEYDFEDAILKAANYGGNDVLRYLINTVGSEISDDFYNSAYISAAKNGNIKGVEIFLDYGVNVDVNNGSALTNSIRENNKDMVQYLLLKGADPNGYNDDASPLTKAVYYANIDIVNTLLEYGAEITPELVQLAKENCDEYYKLFSEYSN